MTNPSPLDTPLRSPARWWLRIAWLLLVGLSIAFALALAPSQIAQAPYHWQIEDSYPAVASLFTRNQFASMVLAIWYGLALLHWAIGLFIFLHRSSDAVALLVALGLALLPLSNNLVGYADWSYGLPLPWPQAMHPIYLGLRSVGLLCYVLILYLFPRGQLAHWPPRGLQRLVLLLFTIFAIAATLQGDDDSLWEDSVQQAVGVEGFTIVLLIFSATFLVGLSAQVAAFRQSTETQQRQVKWVVLGLGLSTLLQLSIWFFYAFPEPHPAWLGLVNQVVSGLAMGIVPVCFGVAILRHHLWDIDLVIRRTLVYGFLIGIIASIYVAIVGGLGIMLNQFGSPLSTALATALVAVLFSPLRSQLHRTVNRMLYGYRDEPEILLAQLGQQLEQLTTPDLALTRIVQTLANALKLPFVALTNAADPPQAIALYGQQPTSASIQHFDLIHHGERLGQLWIAPRSHDETLSRNDQQVLHTLARQLAPAVRAAKLTQELQQSRQRIVTAREEERRRIRRDLHDGLGPTLAAQTLKLDAAIDLLRTGTQPQRAIELLQQLKTQSQALVTDVRHLVYDLRPLALDEIGLINAIRNTALSTPHCLCTIEAPDSLPPLPAAVEVAAYRIISEAMLNVMKHARAQCCRISISLNQDNQQHPWLHIHIEDNGIGIADPAPHGIGLHSMRERAEELGGRFVFTSTVGQGTRIGAQLPI